MTGAGWRPGFIAERPRGAILGASAPRCRPASPRERGEPYPDRLTDALEHWALAGAPAGPRLAVLLVLAPLAEETVFRAGLHESLLRRGLRPFTANLATALAFGLAHVAVQRDLGALMVVAPALLLGVLYQRRRALAPCIVLHALMNALWLAFVLAHPWPPASQS